MPGVSTSATGGRLSACGPDVALGVGILVALNTLIVIVVTVAAQHAQAEPPVDEMDSELRALLLSHVRPLSGRDGEADAERHREAA